MHCELVVPALLGEASGEAPRAPRLPALELLLGRARLRNDERRSAERWLGDAFGLDEAVLPAAALTVLADGGEPADALWLRADPVHLRLMREGLRLIPSAGFALTRDEAEALCATLNAHYAGELVFFALHPQRWCVQVGSGGATLDASPPLELAGADVNANLPGGADAKRWHAVLNEIQMLLHEHPVNEAREQRGAPVVNSVWLWGAGRQPDALASRWHSLAADDPLALGLARRAAMRHRPVPADAALWLDRLPEDGRHLVLLDSLREARALGDAETYGARLQALEARWFAPLLAALRAGRIGMVTIHVPDASEALDFETTRGDLRRFWRRARPIGDYG